MARNSAKRDGVKQSFRVALFDLGVVLLHLRYERAIARTIPLCDPERIAGGVPFLKLIGRSSIVDDHERGEVSGPEFFAHVVRTTGFRGTLDEFTAIWRDIFWENEPMIAFARRVAETRPVYILTNAGELHVPWVFRRFPSLDFHSGVACSWELRAVKPEPAFYERALRQIGVAPMEAVFVDDRPENVAAAEAFGLTSVLYQNPPDAISRVSALLNLA